MNNDTFMNNKNVNAPGREPWGTVYQRIMAKGNNSSRNGNDWASVNNRIMQKARDPHVKMRYNITQPAKAANQDIISWSDLNAEAMPMPKIAQPAKPDIFDKTFRATQPNSKAEQQKANYDYLQRIVAKSNAPSAGERLGAGVNSIWQTAAAAVPMLGSTAKQAAENAAAAANSKEYAAKRAQLFMLQNGLSTTPEYDKRKVEETAARAALQNVVETEQLNKPVAPDSAGMKLMREAKASQQRAVEGLSPTGQFIGNTLISVGQNAAMLPTALINPAAPLVGMGAVAAADKAYGLSEQGVGAGEAFTRGVISGGIESLTEKLPLDNLLKVANTAAGRSAIKSVLQQMGMEATEEAASYVINYAADRAARDPNAEFSLQELALSAAGGALSGGIMGGAAAGVNRLGGVAQYREQNISQTSQNVTENAENVIEAEKKPANSQTVGDLQGEVKNYSADEASKIQKVSKKYINLVNNVDTTIKDFFAKWKDGKTNTDKVEKLYLGKPSPLLRGRISNALGYDVASNDLILTNDNVIHIFKNHGNEAAEISRGNVPVNENNIQRLIETLNGPDKVYAGEIQKDGRPSAVIEKSYPDGTAFCVEVDNSNRGTLEAKTFYIKKSTMPMGNTVSKTALPFTPKATDSVLSAPILPQAQNKSNNNISAEQQNNAQPDMLAPLRERMQAAEQTAEPPKEKPQSLQDVLYRLKERGMTVTQGGVDITAGERTGAFEQRKMREYGVDNINELTAVMSPEDWAAYEERRAQDDNESIDALMYDIDREELAKRARAAAKAPNEKTVELISNPDNGIIETDAINESAQMLANIPFAANKTISQNLDDAVKGAKGDLPLLPNQIRQLRQMLYNAIEKPLAEAKAKYIAGIKSKAGQFAKDMDRLGIKAGSQESAAVQWIGEGQRQGPDGEAVEYTLADLQQQFPDSWQNIMEAAQICRGIYDAYVNEINDALRKVYPDVEKRAMELADKINARIAYNNSQAQIWIDRAAQLEQKAANATNAKHKAGSKAETKEAERANRLNDQAVKARETAERYTRAAAAAEQKAIELQRKIESGEILRNKRLMPRKDYFHHFNEMEQGLGGFVNILTGSHDISAQLAGKSEFTKPKSKWWGALQHRNNGKYTADAVGGMARYIPAAEYKIAFDPFIAQMRGNIEQLVNVTEKTKNANSLIEYLTDWTNDLAGKTNFLDRPFQKIFDRRSMKALEWLNNRAKANAVAGNIGSALVQIGNIPNAMIFIGNPVHWAQAAQDISTGQSRESESVFLNERYINNELDKLQKSSIGQDISNWMLEIGDKQAARLIWNAAYHQFESGDYKGMRQYENAADYADDITRRSIGGRGVGEMALTQKSRIVKLFAPFQVEVNNTWNLLTEKLGERDAAGLMRYAIGAWAINSLLYAITGRRALFDPIDALIDAIKGAMDENEKDERSAAERLAGAAQRIGGEVVSNMPYASTAATMLTGADNSANIFGEADPTRYGTGNIAVQSIAKPVGQLLSGQNVDILPAITSFALPYGGKQAERTIEGAQALGMLPYIRYNTKDGFETAQNEFGASRATSGRIRFPITEPLDKALTLTMGEWSTRRGREYLDEKRTPLGDKQSEAMEKMFAAGISPDDYYDAVIAARKAQSRKDSQGKTIVSQDKDKVRLIKQALPHLTERERKLIYAAMGISKNAW